MSGRSKPYNFDTLHYTWEFGHENDLYLILDVHVRPLTRTSHHAGQKQKKIKGSNPI
jgi:hypothetical protein